ncbi:hypothetical protein J2T49_000287 [Pseudomonas nitroreducens]|nr:hypothetical protein [Pseudomonas nitroreducens]MCP1684360.1 hypothetical protein [Pseudomonas nitroreducens]
MVDFESQLWMDVILHQRSLVAYLPWSCSR